MGRIRRCATVAGEAEAASPTPITPCLFVHLEGVMPTRYTYRIPAVLFIRAHLFPNPARLVHAFGFSNYKSPAVTRILRPHAREAVEARAGAFTDDAPIKRTPG